MLGALTMFRDVAVEGVADPALFARDLIGDDALASFNRVSAQVVAGWQADGRLDGTAKLPWGEFPASFALQFPAMDMLVHGWDLARATGQQHEWKTSWSWTTSRSPQSTLASPEIRAGFYAAPIDVADDAPASTVSSPSWADTPADARTSNVGMSARTGRQPGEDLVPMGGQLSRQDGG